jgi:hypothetical protein
MKRGYIEALQAEIHENYGCACVHVGTEHVHESRGGHTVWDKDVELFDLIGHAKARQCYGWADEHAGQWLCKTVLRIPPVISPRKAVQAYILSAHA